MRAVMAWTSLPMAAFVSLLAAGCGPAGRPPVAPVHRATAPPPPSGPAVVGDVTAASGTTPMDVVCSHDTAERCDAVDDDCDGNIDEGDACGAVMGPIEVAAAWNTDADVNLEVTDPSGETLSPTHPRTAVGGVLDHAARGVCDAGQPHPRLESAHYGGASAPRGAFVVTLRADQGCAQSIEPTTASVTVSVNGSVLGVWNVTVSPPARTDIVHFTMR